MPDPRLRTRVCERFGIEVPIVQTGMGWVSGATLTAASGLSILAAVTMTPTQLEDAVRGVRDAPTDPSA